MMDTQRKRPLAGGRGFDKTNEFAAKLYGTSTPIETLLARLEGVRKSGADSWRAKCPACNHAHDSGSLAISEGSDGVVLAHCFRCGDIGAILGAVGLTVGELFPGRVSDPSPEGRQRARRAFQQSSWAAALGVIASECNVLLAAAGMLRQGHALTADDDARLTLAVDRVERAREVLNGR